jgi:adenylate cyclase
MAMPIVYSDGKVNVITLVSDEPGGFRDADLGQILDMLPALAHVMEAHTLRHFSRTLLQTYLGRFTGERVLDGLIRRGDGEKIQAVIWMSDLRDSTPMAETMPVNDFLGLLDSFFDCTAGAVLDHGGEVLSFIGDAALAIFPISCESGPLKEDCVPKDKACANALNAARDARNRMNQLNEQRNARGESPLGFGLALHVGDLMYGNIGVPERLQFTVIGAAVNHAARLQGLCKDLNHSILASSAFPRRAPDHWISLGRHAMRGISTPQEVFALAGD